MKNIGSILLESSIIIAIITALMYIMGIAYYDGFYSFYEISGFKYDISIQDMVNIMKLVVFHIFSYVSICYSILFLIMLFFKINKHLIHLVILTVIFGVFALMSAPYTRWAAIWVIIPIILHWFIYGIAIIYFKEGKTIFDEDLTNMFINVSKTNPEFNIVIQKVLSVFLIIFVVYFVSSTMYSICYAIGEHQAELKDNYMITDNYNNYILIYQDNDKYIFMPLKDESTLSRKYIYIQTGNVDNLILTPYNQKLSLYIGSSETTEDTRIEDGSQENPPVVTTVESL